MAKRRIAAGVRPGWGGAWGPVIFDAVCLATVLVLLYVPFQILVDRFEFPLWATIVTLFVAAFVPVQVVLIVSSLWAARSRYVDDEKP